MSCEYDDKSHTEFLYEQTKVEDGVSKICCIKIWHLYKVS